MVEELFPTLISVVPEMDVGERVVSGSGGFFDQLHAGVLRAPAAFPDVAGRAGTDDIFPDRFAADTSRDYVVERQFAGWEAFSAVLADVFVAGEDVATVELNFVSRQAVVKQQPDYARHGDMEMYRRNPIVPVRLEVTSQLAELAPAVKIVIRISALLERNNLGEIAEQQGKGTPDTDYADRHVMPVKHKNVAVQTGMMFSKSHRSSLVRRTHSLRHVTTASMENSLATRSHPQRRLKTAKHVRCRSG